MKIGIELVRRGLITMEELFAAVEMQAESQPPLGRLAIRKRKMNMSQWGFPIWVEAGTDPDSQPSRL